MDDEIGKITTAEYTYCFTCKWPVHWACCMYRDRDYFEGLSTAAEVQKMGYGTPRTVTCSHSVV